MEHDSQSQQKSPKHGAALRNSISILLISLGVLLVFLFFKEHSGGQPTWIKSSGGLPSKEEKNGFITYFPGHDVYDWTISPQLFRIGGADGCFEYHKAGGDVWKLDLPYVYAILDHQGALYIASDSGLYIYKDHREIRRPMQTFLRDKRLRMLYEDAHNMLWAGGFGGVTSEKGQHYDAASGLLCDMVNVMLSTTSDSPENKNNPNAYEAQQLWFGSYSIRNGGITIIDREGNEDAVVTTEKDLVHPNVNVLLQLDEQHVLTGGGFYDAGGGNLFSRRGNTWVLTDELTKKEDALPGEKVRSAALDRKGRLWIGSEYSGLGVFRFRIVEDKMQLTPLAYLRKTDGLADDEIKKMAEDDTYYYFGTRNGLSVIRKADFDHLFPGI